jgi:hypothetical protein
VADGRDGGQPHLAVGRLAQVDGDALEPVQLLVDQRGLFKQHARFRRGRQRALAAREQLVAQLQFGVCNGLADGRGRDADQPRGGTHVARLHDSLEDFKLPEVHRSSGCRRGEESLQPEGVSFSHTPRYIMHRRIPAAWLR